MQDEMAAAESMPHVKELGGGQDVSPRTARTHRSARKKNQGRIGDDPDNFRPLGNADNVPLYLQTESNKRISNPRMSADDVMKLIKDLLKRKPTEKDVEKYFLGLLQKRYTADNTVTEHAYSFIDVCERLAPESTLCWLALRSLDGSIPDDLYSNMLKEVQNVAVAISSKMKEEGKWPVPVSSVFTWLENCLPSKSVESHMKLRFVLLFSMDFRTEITEQQSQELLSTAVGKSRFVEELRRQFVLEYDDYFNEVQSTVLKLDKTHNKNSIASLGDIAHVFKEVDPRLKEEEIRRRILVGVSEQLRKTFEKSNKFDFSQTVKVDEFFKKVGRKCYMKRESPSVLLRPNGLWAPSREEDPDDDDDIADDVSDGHESAEDLADADE
jgi:hypothetical protein